VRRLWARNAPPEILQRWPEARQIVAVHIAYEKRHPRANVRADEWHYYLVTGPKGMRRLGAKQLARIIRNHWGIENRLHHVLDRTFREDQCQVKAGCGAMAMGWAARIALTLLSLFTLRKNPHAHMPTKRNYFQAHPQRALRLLQSCQ
jgi:hypothetical protein